MRILAVNGSPRGAAGNTEYLLRSFLAGAGEAGAEAETVYLKGKRIEHCLGCYRCWLETPGVCVHRDDMPALLEKMSGWDPDVVVLATPLYIYTFSGLMKDFLDRLLPTVKPELLIDGGGRMHHPPRRERSGVRRYVLITNAGFLDRRVFAGLEETMRLFASSPGEELAGTICCAAGEMFSQAEARPHLAWYLEACRQAGREVVAHGRIQEATREILDRPLLRDPELFVRMANAYLAGRNESPAMDGRAPAAGKETGPGS